MKTLPGHLRESGLVTSRELELAKRWIDAVTVDRKNSGDSARLDNWLHTAAPFSFNYGEQASADLLGKWTRKNNPKQQDSVGERQAISWIDPAASLRVEWELKRFLDFPAVEWVLNFTNTGSQDTPIIKDVQALDLCLNRTGSKPYRVHGLYGGRSSVDDLMPFAHSLPGSPPVELGGDWPSSNRHLPFFNLEVPEDKGVLVGVGWSGIWQAQVKVDGEALQARVSQKHLHLYLRPGESIRSPRVLLLFWEGQRLHGHNMLRQLLHRHYVPRLFGKLPAPLVSTNAGYQKPGDGGEYLLHQATEKAVLPLVAPFIKLGVELFIIDAGWYEGDSWDKYMGDWKIAKSKYPRGFRPISEPLAAAKVAFGVWFAAEVVHADVPLAHAHPEWVRKNMHLGHNDALRMELPKAREWFLQQVRYLADHEGMTCYRQDFGGYYGDEPEDRKGFMENQHTGGLYAVWDAIVRQYPKMIMEGCCGGGRRIDLETLSRFHWHQKSDRLFDSESDQCGLYGANLYLPGGLINIPGRAADDYSAWSCFAGQLCLAWRPLAGDFPLAQAGLQVKRYKRIRSLLSGDFYPLTPCALDAPWLGYQFHRNDLDRGFALVFHRSMANIALHPVTGRFRCQLRGVAPKAHYRVCFEREKKEKTLTGEELANGLDIDMPEIPGAEMIVYEAIK